MQDNVRLKLKRRVHSAHKLKKVEFQNAKIGEKRSIDDNEVDGSRKLACNVRSHLRNQQLITKLTKQLNSIVIWHSNDINNDPISTTDALQLQNTKIWLKFLSSRSERNTRLPARF
jgi:hypothetical protein